MFFRIPAKQIFLLSTFDGNGIVVSLHSSPNGEKINAFVASNDEMFSERSSFTTVIINLSYGVCPISNSVTFADDPVCAHSPVVE